MTSRNNEEISIFNANDLSIKFITDNGFFALDKTEKTGYNKGTAKERGGSIEEKQNITYTCSASYSCKRY